jgi:hypothetical protein
LLLVEPKKRVNHKGRETTNAVPEYQHRDQPGMKKAFQLAEYKGIIPLSGEFEEATPFRGFERPTSSEIALKANWFNTLFRIILFI